MSTNHWPGQEVTYGTDTALGVHTVTTHTTISDNSHVFIVKIRGLHRSSKAGRDNHFSVYTFVW